MPLTQVPPGLIASSAVTAPTVGSGSIATANLADAAVTTAKIADAAVTPAKLSQKLTLGTVVATTSGTAIDLSTAIPSWVKRITIAYNGVSLSGSANTIIQLGSGSYTTSGYVASSGYTAPSNAAGQSSATNGLCVTGGTNANAFTGTMTLVNISGNTWVASHSGNIGAGYAVSGGGSVALSGVLDRIRIASANGTDTFDAGAINALIEG